MPKRAEKPKSSPVTLFWKLILCVLAAWGRLPWLGGPICGGVREDGKTPAGCGESMAGVSALDWPRANRQDPLTYSGLARLQRQPSPQTVTEFATSRRDVYL
jgi:hypothetical protein